MELTPSDSLPHNEHTPHTRVHREVFVNILGFLHKSTVTNTNHGDGTLSSTSPSNPLIMILTVVSLMIFAIFTCYVVQQLRACFPNMFNGGASRSVHTPTGSHATSPNYLKAVSPREFFPQQSPSRRHEDIELQDSR